MIKSKPHITNIMPDELTKIDGVRSPFSTLAGPLSEVMERCRMFQPDPNVTDIPLDKMVRLDGVDGPFFVTTAGANPWLDDCHFYGDDTYQFFFYARRKNMPDGKSSIEIHHATTKRMTGPRPRISHADLARVEANITKLFTERRYLFLDKPMTVGWVPPSIDFTWRSGR
jgi:hypothetical protein